MAVLTEEPTNGLGFFSCGECPTWFQEVIPVLDENGQPTFNEEGQQIFTTDDHVAWKEMHVHAKEEHHSE